MDVLIVDDDPKVLEAHAKVLERAGFMVTAADNGLAALAELQQHTYRVILCDIQMPFLEGKSFYHQLQEALPSMARRVIFVTGWAQEARTQRFLRKAGRPYLQKPAKATDLVNVVRQVADSPARAEDRG